ncbi:MAG: hypothetical protein PUC32_03855 [Oscillospiraceae bacterium]|nr:hypothetical protein [Oscillospiraceae bacterium]
MKKRSILLLAAMAAATLLTLSGCGSKATVTTADYTEDETAIVGSVTDVAARFALPTTGSATIKLETYQKGQKVSESEMRNVQGADGNNYLYVSGVNSSGLDYVWTITAPGGRMTYPTPYFNVEDGASMIRITDVGETEFSLDDGKTHLLYYVAYKSGQDSSTISEKPFHEWSNQSNQEQILEQFDCAYLITMTQQQEQ